MIKLNSFKAFRIFLPLVCLILLTIPGCNGHSSNEAQISKAPKAFSGDNSNVVQVIKNEEEFKKILENSNQLMVFDLYADWCKPCRILSPILEKIAKQNKEKANFYKVNVDQLPQIASAFNVNGIPYVVFLKNKSIVYALTGLYPMDAYIKIINRFSEKGNEEMVSNPDGKIVNGIRVIHFQAGIKPKSIFVYRGETVQINIDKMGYPFSIHIPEYGISQKAERNKGLKITFNAKKTGIFPIFCNGNCPAGDGAQHGKIVVMPFKGSENANFKEMTPIELHNLINQKSPLILDVRTPKEFYDGHIPGAQLIPLQQLSYRLSEIKDYKEKDIIVYCRSGNRSVVASEILIEKGFKKIYHLRSGIKGWITQGFNITSSDINANI